MAGPKSKRQGIVTREVADVIAFLVALGIAIAGFVFVLGDGPSFDQPEKKTTVVEASTGSGVGKSTRAVEIEESGGVKKGKKSTTSVERPSGSPSGKETTTVERAPRSFPERTLGRSGLVLLQLGIVLLAAFLAGAFTQRVLVGDFALKLGGVLEIGALQERTVSTSDALEKLTAALTKLEAANAQKADSEKVKELSDTLGNLSVTLTAAVTQLNDRVKVLEKDVI